MVLTYGREKKKCLKCPESTRNTRRDWGAASDERGEKDCSCAHAREKKVIGFGGKEKRAQ